MVAQYADDFNYFLCFFWVAALWAAAAIILSILEARRRSQAKKRKEMEALAAERARRNAEEARSRAVAWFAERAGEAKAFEAWKQSERERWAERVNEMEIAHKRLAAEKCIGFPWLALAYADYFHLEDLKEAQRLEDGERPIPKAAAKVRQLAHSIRDSVDTKLGEMNAHIHAYMEAGPDQRDTLRNRCEFGLYWLKWESAELLTQAEMIDKGRPAPKAAEKIRDIAAKRRKAEKALRIYQYQNRYYETLFPWLTDFKDQGIDELITIGQDGIAAQIGAVGDEDEDPARKWLSAAEYNQLSSAEKYQKALDRYLGRQMNRWQVGRAYERYAGYLYETRGYEVRFEGIIKGFEDLGRDVIAKDGNNVEIVQCKRWSKKKTIHEKHIFQLFGTVMAFRLDNPSLTATACFMTSTMLSERAKLFAEQLGIKVDEGHEPQPYPCIKCNISRGNNERIYHLPFDQQYDRILIEPTRGECYAETVAEAESLGFRRAYRWRGEK